MLSNLWPLKIDEQKRNFYRSFPSIMLDMARIPLPKIVSFTTHDSSGMSLDNRPLTMQRPLLESSGIPVSIPRGRTYITTDSYICDLLDCHDMKLRQQPNSVRDDYGAEG